MTNLTRLLDEPYFSYEEFMDRCQKKSSKKFVLDIQSDRENYSLASFITSLYHERVNVRSVKKSEEELSYDQTYTMVEENLAGIESYILLWISNHIEKLNNEESFVEDREGFLRLPLFEKVERTKGVIPSHYISDRNVTKLIKAYHHMKTLKHPFQMIGFYD